MCITHVLKVNNGLSADESLCQWLLAQVYSHCGTCDNDLYKVTINLGLFDSHPSTHIYK